MSTRGILGALAMLALSVVPGCRSIALNHAMERVHFDYLRLFREIELRDEPGIREAARGLLDALDDPAITGYSSDAEYQELLAASAESVQYFAGVSVEIPDGSGDGRELVKARKRVFESCDACHRSYRR